MCEFSRLASVSILGKEREPRVGNLGLHADFDTGFEMIHLKSRVRYFLNILETAIFY